MDAVEVSPLLPSNILRLPLKNSNLTTHTLLVLEPTYYTGNCKWEASLGKVTVADSLMVTPNNVAQLKAGVAQ